MRGWIRRGPPGGRVPAVPFRPARGCCCACSCRHCPLRQTAWQLRAPELSTRHTRRSAKYVRAMIPTRLQQILEVKRAEVAKLLPRLAHLREVAVLRNDFRGFAAALDRGPSTLGVIAEVKKASPSAGVIAKDFDPV